MFWLAFLFYVGHSRPLASQCTNIPAGSNMTNANGDNIVFIEPVVTGKCETHQNEDHNGIHVNSHMFVCNGTAGAQLLDYGYDVGDCSGTATATPITLNGSCTAQGCFAYNEYQWDVSGCAGNVEQNFTNEYRFWNPSGCMYNAYQVCVSGFTHISYFNFYECCLNTV
eukprot:577435_1